MAKSNIKNFMQETEQKKPRKKQFNKKKEEKGREKSQKKYYQKDDSNVIDSEEDLDKYLNQLRQKNRYDPRSDIEEDHYIWQELLQVAEQIDKEGYWLLHGLRCAGCRLRVDNNGSLKLDLFNSEELLMMYVNKKRLEKKGIKKMNKKLKKKAVKKVKIVELKQKLTPLKRIFHQFNKWLKKKERKLKNKQINISQLNKFWEEKQNASN